MKHVILVALLLISALGFSQSQYSKAIVYANGYELQQLAEAGVPVDHGAFKRDHWLISDFSQHDLHVIAQMGLEFEVLIPDVQAYYQSRLTNNPVKHDVYMMGDPHLKHLRGAGCPTGGGGSGVIDYPQPSNFSLGSMGGYFTYQEYLNNLDAMVAQYPNLITAKVGIDSTGGTFLSHNGDPIYWVRISDNPNTDEPNEPEVMYSAIHHAREPASLSSLIYYMWYLLENYGTDAEVTYLVDNMELYFAPMVNPDGYRYNQTTNPGGGGMWRKNRRNNGGSFGVDLNRNYSYQYGFSGASTDPTDDTYRGPYAFSEPEVRAMRQWHFDHDFRIAMNAHTYGDLLLFPFGYDYVQTSDHNIFQAWGSHMVSQNGFSAIQSVDLYPAAGDSDDWAYAGELGSKPKVMAFTPEIGADSHGFWPASGEIIPICKGAVFMNLNAAHLSWIFGIASDANPQVIEDQNGFLKFNFQRYGLEPGSITVDIAPVGFGIASVGSGQSFNLANILDNELDSISYSLEPTLLLGQTFEYELIVSNGSYTWRDTITKTYGQAALIFADDASSMTNWTSSTWTTTTSDFVSAPTSITDSPGGDYSNNSSTQIVLDQQIDLTNATAATMTFHAKWDIEDNWDYAQVMASTNGGSSWTPLCGLYTETGTNNQDSGEPVYDGVQNTWVAEEVDLVDYLGQVIDIRFRLVSDQFVTGDGFYFDDVQVNAIVDSTDGIVEHVVQLGQNMPNPATNYTYIPYDINEPAILVIYNSMGQMVRSQTLQPGKLKIEISTIQLSDGVYHYQLVSPKGKSTTKRFVVVK